jgi:hypothetical protein
MYPLHCPKCGRWLADSHSTGHGNAISNWEESWGTSKVHGIQHRKEH